MKEEPQYHRLTWGDLRPGDSFVFERGEGTSAAHYVVLRVERAGLRLVTVTALVCWGGGSAVEQWHGDDDMPYHPDVLVARGGAACNSLHNQE